MIVSTRQSSIHVQKGNLTIYLFVSNTPINVFCQIFWGTNVLKIQHAITYYYKYRGRLQGCYSGLIAKFHEVKAICVCFYL